MEKLNRLDGMENTFQDVEKARAVEVPPSETTVLVKTKFDITQPRGKERGYLTAGEQIIVKLEDGREVAILESRENNYTQQGYTWTYLLSRDQTAASSHLHPGGD